MNIIIDTHILLDVLFQREKLTKKDLFYILDENNEVFISGISLFEISLKYSLGKLELKNTRPDEIPASIIENGYQIEISDSEIFSTFYKLEKTKHKDPFDRLIIWHAIRRNYYLLSHDSEFPQYRKYGLKLLK